jgi:hypothetical protein
MSKKTAGTFTKEIVMDTKGSLQIDVDLIVLGQAKSYTGVATVIIEEGTAIGKVRLYSDSIDKTKLNVTRETIGTAPRYEIAYGTSSSNLAFTTIVPTNEIIIENLAIGEKYYFQITPLDDVNTPIGNPSEITEARIGEDNSCTVVGITVTTGQIGEKYYLMRS